MAKIVAYKLVNPGGAASASPAVAAARKQTLAFNRLGMTVTSMGNLIADVEKISMLRSKNEQKELIAERRRKRREKDAAAEESVELNKELKKNSKQKPEIGSKLKSGAKKSLGFIDKFLGPIGGVLMKVAAFAITNEILKWVGDPKNSKKLSEFLRKTKFVFEKLFGWAKGFTTNILDGISALADPNGDFKQKLGGLGKIMLGIIGLKYLMNPFSLINDILGLVDLLGRRGDRPPRVDKSKRVTQEATEQATKRVTKEATEKVAQKTGSELVEAGGKQATGQILKYGGKNISRATHRLFLKIIGKGGVKGLKKAIGAFKVPLISGILTAALNWMMGESIAKSLMMGIGDGIGTLLGTWAGSALGALGGPAAPITVPLGAFLGAMLGGIAGELIGGYLYDLMMGKANLGDDLKAAGAKVMSSLKSLWNDYIMNGDFWAGAWETFLNIGKDVMSSAWGAMMNMWNFAAGKAADFFTHMMEISKPWRQAMWTAFEKYVLNGPAELVKLIIDTVFAGAKGIGKLFKEGAPIILQIVKLAFEEGIKWAIDKVGSLWRDIRSLDLGRVGRATAELLRMINAPITFAGEVFNAIGKGVSKKVGEALAKAKEIGEIIIEPIMGYIDPALKAIDETWKIVSNFPGYVYDKGIKPIFDAIGNVWNSGPAIWEYLHRPNTFQELTGQEVPAEEPQGLFLGGVVKGIKNAVGGIGKAVSNVVSNPIVQTAASFIPGAAPIMAGIGMATNMMQGNFNPMSVLSAASSMIPGVGTFMSSPLGQVGQSILTGGFSPTAALGSLADQFGVGSIYNAVMGAVGGDYNQAINIAANEIGISPAAVSAGKKMLSKGGFSAEYAMEQAIEFLPVPIVLEKIVPMPQAVPINTGSNVVKATPTSLQTRMR